jgi:hypothetical protein
MTDEELTQAMTDAVIFGTGVMQDGKRIDPLSFFVQPVSDPACEHCGMDPAALTEQLEAARADTKKAVELLIVCRDMFDEVAHPSDPLSKMLNDTLAEIEGGKT